MVGNLFTGFFCKVKDQTIACVGCGQPFVFTAGEQRFFKSKNFVPPKRCPACRAKRRQERPPSHEKKNSFPIVDINKLQQKIMQFVGKWVEEEETPVPHKEILIEMERQGVKSYTTVNALHALLEKGYIRKAVVSSNRTFYVQLRWI